MILRQIASMSLVMYMSSVAGCIDSSGDSPQTNLVHSSILVPRFNCAILRTEAERLRCLGIIFFYPVDIRIPPPLGDPPPFELVLETLTNDLNDEATRLENAASSLAVIKKSLETVVLNDYLEKFDTDIAPNDIDVCMTIAGLLLCQ